MNQKTANIIFELSEAYEQQIEQLQEMFEKGKAWLSDSKNADKPLLLHQLVKSQLNLIRRRLKRALANQSEFESEYLPDEIHDTLEEASELILDMQRAIKIRKKGGTIPDKEKEKIKRGMALWHRDHLDSKNKIVQRLSQRITAHFVILRDKKA
ncbi:MAG: hypothetical protein AAF598_00145 [Bacteroidota bacterium]